MVRGGVGPGLRHPRSSCRGAACRARTARTGAVIYATVADAPRSRIPRPLVQHRARDTFIEVAMPGLCGTPRVRHARADATGLTRPHELRHGTRPGPRVLEGGCPLLCGDAACRARRAGGAWITRASVPTATRTVSWATRGHTLHVGAGGASPALAGQIGSGTPDPDTGCASVTRAGGRGARRRRTRAAASAVVSGRGAGDHRDGAATLLTGSIGYTARRAWPGLWGANDRPCRPAGRARPTPTRRG